MNPLKRRDFLKRSAGSAATFTLLSSARGAPAADKVVLGIMGVGGRGRFLVSKLAERDDVHIKTICDADSRAYDLAAKVVFKAKGHKPKYAQDFRKMLEDKEIDAIVNATSDRWHALGSIMACQAGKDVYVEKPLSLSIWDGRKMVEAARKYNRIVQVGMQTRSAEYAESAAQYVRDGKLGDVYLTRVFFIQDGYPIAEAPEQPVPDTLDYDLWCGPSPMMPYRPGRWFHKYWDFYTGAITADMIHQLDIARYVIGKDYPDTVCHAGGVQFYEDGREQPDTQFATFEMGKQILLIEAALRAPFMHRIVHLPREKAFPDWPFSATKVEILGTQGIMYLGRHGGGWEVYEGNKKTRESHPVISTPSERKYPDIVEWHFDDFINCIRTRQKPKADVEEGHRSMVFCHMANIAYRVGNRKLRFDAQTESFVDDAEANKLLKANYRAPWAIPDKV